MSSCDENALVRLVPFRHSGRLCRDSGLWLCRASHGRLIEKFHMNYSIKTFRHATCARRPDPKYFNTLTQITTNTLRTRLARNGRTTKSRHGLGFLISEAPGEKSVPVGSPGGARCETRQCERDALPFSTEMCMGRRPMNGSVENGRASRACVAHSRCACIAQAAEAESGFLVRTLPTKPTRAPGHREAVYRVGPDQVSILPLDRDDARPPCRLNLVQLRCERGMVPTPCALRGAPFRGSLTSPWCNLVPGVTTRRGTSIWRRADAARKGEERDRHFAGVVTSLIHLQQVRHLCLTSTSVSK